MEGPRVDTLQETLRQRLEALELTSLPIWVFDDARMRFLWANTAALELWRAPDREELLARDLSDASEATRTRIGRYRTEFAEGRTVWDVWTFYPKGVATSVNCRHTPFDAGDGYSALFVEAHPTASGVDPELLRGIEALRHTSVMVTLLDEAGQVLTENPAAIRAFGEAQFDRRFLDASTASTIQQAVGQDAVFRTEVLARTSVGSRWHLLEARRTRDPATGQTALLIEQVDINARRENELTIARQGEEILALSAPVIAIGKGVLAVPLVGTLAEERGARLMERLLTEVVERQARHVVIDLTGAALEDARSAERLARVLKAISLMGVRPIVTGIQPSLARTFTGMDGVARETLIVRDVHQALVCCGLSRD